MALTYHPLLVGARGAFAKYVLECCSLWVQHMHVLIPNVTNLGWPCGFAGRAPRTIAAEG